MESSESANDGRPLAVDHEDVVPEKLLTDSSEVSSSTKRSASRDDIRLIVVELN